MSKLNSQVTSVKIPSATKNLGTGGDWLLCCGNKLIPDRGGADLFDLGRNKFPFPELPMQLTNKGLLCTPVFPPRPELGTKYPLPDMSPLAHNNPQLLLHRYHFGSPSNFMHHSPPILYTIRCITSCH